ncbi:DNA gyrase inhibitor YacG [Sutterella sp.]|uniref:DNA gyrase inhibitor YacG n=1 Tax=Sutterella sp. TaxID=1981025 RepID=UPI0026E02C57|nr:DNA gyrase inhibitor YacG [Sutterella sp.]MDO5530822.1 DNA gyrase inhibitor YacG [Sutterella sp.]
MKVPCPVCGTTAEYSPSNPWRPFCSERCKLIDLGEWGTDGYRIAGEPGSADRMSPEDLEDAALRAAELAAKNAAREGARKNGARGRRR